MSRPAIAVRFFIGRMSAGPSGYKKETQGMKIQFAVNVAKNNKEHVDLWFMDEGLSKIKETENRK